MSRFVFGLYVEQDLRDIRDYVGTNSLESARRLMNQFVRAFRILAKHPLLGHTREDLLPPSFRFWSVGSYLIIYTCERQPVKIVAVVHGARDIPHVVNRRL